MKSTLHLLLTFATVIGCIFHSDAQIISTIAGTGGTGHTGNGGAATLATLDIPTALAVDNAGNIYINDQGNNCVRKIDHATGIIRTIAGDGTVGFYGDGGPAIAAKLGQNWGIAVDGPGNVYIADQNNHRIRKVDLSGNINTIAGTGANNSMGDGGPALAAGIRRPVGMTIDGAGNLYVCDQDTFRIRKINTAGIISTVAGNGLHGYTGDGGPATNATFNAVYGIATDRAGNLYICDGDNNCIRKVTPAGIINTVAGNGTPGFFGDGGPAVSANLSQPTGVLADPEGNIYIADCHNNRIRVVNRFGIISTMAGTGTPGFSGDGGRATLAELNFPLYLTIDSNENLYVSDLNNERIREIKKAILFMGGHNQYLQVCEDVPSVSIDSLLAITDLNTGVSDIWKVSQPPTRGSVSFVTYTAASTGGTIVPTGLYYTPNGGFFGNDSFKVTVSDGLDSNFLTVYLTVIPKITYAGVINGPSHVCVGSSITLSDTTGSGTWSISNLNAIVSNGIVTGESPGADTVKYTISNTCGSATSIKPVIVHALPNAGKISGTSAICIGSSALLTDTASSGIWSASNSNLIINSTGVITGITAGLDTVFYTVNDAFCSALTTLSVRVDTFPKAIVIPGDTTVCVGSIFHVTGSPDGGVWTAGNANITLSQEVVTAVSAGVSTITYAYTNSCGTDSAIANVKINPLPVVPVITQNGSTISVPSDYTAYQWLLNGSPILGSTVDTYLVATTGLYSVFVKNAFGCSVISQGIVVAGCTPDDISVFPNPTQSVVYVKWCKKLAIRLLSDDGKEIEVAKGANQADLSYLPNADYFIVIYDMNGIKIKTKRVTKLAK